MAAVAEVAAAEGEQEEVAVVEVEEAVVRLVAVELLLSPKNQTIPEKLLKGEWAITNNFRSY